MIKKFDLKGGNFHNILVTVYVSGGIINLGAFLLIILYMSYKFLRYLVQGGSSYTKLCISLYFGILFGQLFESIILYSTSFIRPFSGHCQEFLCSYDKKEK